MIGIYGVDRESISLACRLAQFDLEPMIVTAFEEELEELSEGLSHYPKKLTKAYKDYNKKIKVSGNTAALFSCDFIFVSARMVRGEENPAEAMRFYIKDVSTLLRAAKDREAQVNLVLFEELPYRGFEALMEALSGEEFSELDYKIAYAPVFDGRGEVNFLSRPAYGLIGCEDEALDGKLAQLYRKIGVPKRKIYRSTPKGVDDALILDDAYRLTLQAFVNEATRVSDDDLFYDLISVQKIPKASFGINHKLTERLEGLKAMDKKLQLFEKTLTHSLQEADDSVEGILEKLKSLDETGAVTVIGFMQQPGESDMRGATALKLFEALAHENIPIRLYAPEGYSDLKWRLRDFNEDITYCASFAEASRGAHVLLVLGTPGFGINLKNAAARMKDPVLLDPYGILAGRKGLDNFYIL